MIRCEKIKIVGTKSLSSTLIFIGLKHYIYRSNTTYCNVLVYYNIQSFQLENHLVKASNCPSSSRTAVLDMAAKATAKQIVFVAFCNTSCKLKP